MKNFRVSLGLSQKEFADYFGLPLRTLQDWEQGRHKEPSYLLPLLKRILEQDELLNSLTETTNQ